MADRIDLDRATDDTLALVTDATAYFFAAGTSTPLDVYTDNGLGTPRGSSVAADAEGVFPPCWVASGTAVKVDVRDGAGVSLPGFPNDNAGRFPEGGSAASDVVFAPVTGNTATDGQTAIANNTAGLNILNELARPVIATGSGGAYAIAANTTITAYATGQVFTFIANHTNVGGGSDTLNVDSRGAVALKRRYGATSKSNPAVGDIGSGDTLVVQYDGTNFVIVDHFTGDVFRVNTQGDLIAGSSTGSASRVAIGTAGQYLRVNAAGTDPEWSGVPSVLAWVSFDGTGTPSISGSFNVSSITDNGTGDYTINFSDELGSAAYAVTATCSTNASGGGSQSSSIVISARATTSVRVIAEWSNPTSGGNFDPTLVCVVVTGGG